MQQFYIDAILYLTSHLHKDIAPHPFHLGFKGLPRHPGEGHLGREPRHEMGSSARCVKEGYLSYFALYYFCFSEEMPRLHLNPTSRWPGVGVMETSLLLQVFAAER